MKKKRMKKQAIKIPEAIVEQVATELVNDLFLDWDKSLLKKCGVPSKKELVNKVVDEINNCQFIKEWFDNIGEMIIESFRSDILYDYHVKLSAISSINTTTLEQQLIQQITDMGYEVKKVRK